MGNKKRTIVVKYGGAAMQSEALKAGVMRDTARAASDCADVVLIHGGGPELSSLQKRLGLETRFVDGVRYTDTETVNAALMALCGKVNKDLVRLLQNEGRMAAGLSGIDGGILRCKKQESPDLGFVGEILSVDTSLLRTLLNAGVLPIVSTLGLGEDGLAYNINADTAAGRIAASLSADLFITISDVPGVLRDVNDPESLIAEIRTGEIDGLIETGVLSGGMIPKIRGLEAAVRLGVGSAVMIDGRTPHTLARLLCLGSSGNGREASVDAYACGTRITT